MFKTNLFTTLIHNKTNHPPSSPIIFSFVQSKFKLFDFESTSKNLKFCFKNLDYELKEDKLGRDLYEHKGGCDI